MQIIILRWTHLRNCKTGEDGRNLEVETPFRALKMMKCILNTSCIDE